MNSFQFEDAGIVVQVHSQTKVSFLKDGLNNNNKMMMKFTGIKDEANSIICQAQGRNVSDL